MKVVLISLAVLLSGCSLMPMILEDAVELIEFEKTQLPKNQAIACK
jgi:hypothetical protein